MAARTANSSSRKRDRILLKVFPPRSRGPSPQPVPAGSLPTTTRARPSSSPTRLPHTSTPLTSTPLTLGHRILNEALRSLSEQQKAVLRPQLVSGPQDIRAAVEEAYGAAERRRRQCEDDRWSWTFNGREVILRDIADKIVLWIDRFKFAGDIASNVAPLHFGLPWIGIRMVLEMSTSDANQMANLLTGMELALSVSNRLKVYLEHLDQLREMTAAKSNFESALVKLYALTLKFLANALSVYHKAPLARISGALWQSRAFEDFENQSDKLDRRTAAAASDCAWELQSKRWQLAEKWKADLDSQLQTLDEIHDLRTTLDTVQVQLSMMNLATAKGAAWDCFEAQNLPRCLGGTRVDLLDQICDWANSKDGKVIFWLCGKAGTGKSTISRTVAETFAKKKRYLEASFFFKRGEGDLGDASRFFPTLAAQLAGQVPSLKQEISTALTSTQHVTNMNMRDQFKNLLLNPLRRAMRDHGQGVTVSLVVDALDECESAEDLQRILSLLPEIQQIPSLRVRIFLTSRPELPVDLGFKNIHENDHRDVFLEEFQLPAIEQDLRLYFRDQFQSIKSKRRQRRRPDILPADWPTVEQVDALVVLAIPLFIFAFTVCRWLSQSSPEKRLHDFLAGRQSMPSGGLDRTYLPIFTSIIRDRADGEQEQAAADFRAILGPIVLLADSLSVASLSSILKIERREIHEVLEYLHSVLHVPSNDKSPVKLLHLSLRDYLVDPKKRTENPLWISEVDTHRTLADCCLQRLQEPDTLVQDMCQVRSPGARRTSYSQQYISDAIPADVAYACTYWTLHLTKGEKQLYDHGAEHHFLKVHFLHWLEALSWLGRLSQAVAFVDDLQKLVHIKHGDELLAFLADAKRFLLRHRHVIDLAPRQTYISALMFSPTRSIVRMICGGQDFHGLKLIKDMQPDWSSEILKLEGHHDQITALTFSPDGHTLASASLDKAVRLWDVTTGEHVQTLDGHDSRVSAVIFSSDGQVVATASWDHTIRLWNVVTGNQLQKLEGHIREVLTIAFSPDGQLLASGSRDHTIRLWNMVGGKYEQTRKLEGHEDDVLAVAYSSDGQHVVSVSYDGTFRLWDAATGEQLRRFEPHSDIRITVAISPDSLIATVSQDRAVRIWDMEGHEKLRIDNHEGGITGLSFFGNGRKLLVSSRREVGLWDVTSGKHLQTFQSKGEYGSPVAFSPSRPVAASTCFDVVKLWDTSANQLTASAVGHEQPVSAIAFSPDGQTIVTACWDMALQLWDASRGVEGTPKKRLEGHENYISEVCLSADGRSVASIDGQTMRIWDAVKGKQTWMLEHESFEVAVFSPDGAAVATASTDETVRLWSVTTGEELVMFRVFTQKLAFTWDGQHLETEEGLLDVSAHVSPPAMSASASPPPPPKLELDDPWIRRGGEDVLWLPHEYRGPCWASYDNLLVLGQASGDVTFFTAV